MQFGIRSLTAASALAVAAAAFAAPASAADLRDYGGGGGSFKDGPAIASWSGFYVGAYVGYSWGQVDSKFDSFCENAAFAGDLFAVDCLDLDEGDAGVNEISTSDDIDTDTFLAGGIIGYNVQVSTQTILGIEVSGGSARHEGSRSSNEILNSGITQFSSDDGSITIDGDNGATLDSDVSRDWELHLSARMGWLMTPQTLLFVKGGLSWTDLAVSEKLRNETDTVTLVKASDTLLGAHVGLGVESQLSTNWLIRLEGQATWYESLDVDIEGEVLEGEYSGSASYEPSDISVKAGLIYKIN